MVTETGLEPATSWSQTRRDAITLLDVKEEGVRFERTVGRPTAVFKTAGLSHSPNPPKYW